MAARCPEIGLLPRFARRVLAVLVLALVLLGTAAGFEATASGLGEFRGARLVADPANSGNGFLVEFDGGRRHVRLYYVDSPEIKAETGTEKRRLREQTQYWQASGPEHVFEYGRKAKAFVERELDGGFTLHTSLASAPGGQPEGRILAFVTTARGEDLGAVLVKNGLARVRGVGRKTPDGTPRDLMVAKLQEMELAAAVKGAGVWSVSLSETVAALRRGDSKAKDALRSQLFSSPRAIGRPLNPNTASSEELQSLPGVGPALAERIIGGRPYSKLEDMLKVPGIGQATLENLRPNLLGENEW